MDRRKSRARAASRETPQETAAKSKRKPKYVYSFGNKKADGNGNMKPLLGGKGANLAEMSRIGLPVPPGFTITTEVCTYYYANKRTYPQGAASAQTKAGIAFIEKIMGTKFGDQAAMPLLVSVRSGARDSMPGMMDTILNLGLNDRTVLALVASDEERTFRVGLLSPVHPDVWRRRDGRAEARRTKIMSRSKTVIHELKHERHHKDIEDTKLSGRRSEGTGDAFQGADRRNAPAKNFRKIRGSSLWGAVGAVFGSWMNDRAIVYRRKYNIPSEWGTAVNVQAMVYGNTGEQFRFGRGLHARSGHRRESFLRRIPDQRPGRRRGGRRAHAGTGGRS